MVIGIEFDGFRPFKLTEPTIVGLIKEPFMSDNSTLNEFPALNTPLEVKETVPEYSVVQSTVKEAGVNVVEIELGLQSGASPKPVIVLPLLIFSKRILGSDQ